MITVSTANSVSKALPIAERGVVLRNNELTFTNNSISPGTGVHSKTCKYPIPREHGPEEVHDSPIDRCLSPVLGKSENSLVVCNGAPWRPNRNNSSRRQRPPNNRLEKHVNQGFAREILKVSKAEPDPILRISFDQR